MFFLDLTDNFNAWRVAIDSIFDESKNIIRMQKREELKKLNDPALLLEQEKIWAIEDAGEDTSDAISNAGNTIGDAVRSRRSFWF